MDGEGMETERVIAEAQRVGVPHVVPRTESGGMRTGTARVWIAAARSAGAGGTGATTCRRIGSGPHWTGRKSARQT